MTTELLIKEHNRLALRSLFLEDGFSASIVFADVLECLN